MPPPRQPAPMDIPDQDARDPGPDLGAAYGFRCVWLAALVAGALCVMVAFNVPAVQAATWAGLACFAGIVARIVQAEEYRVRAERTTEWRMRQQRRP